MSPADIEKLAILLDVLIPGDADFPSPGTIGLAPRLATHERFEPTATMVLGLLADGFQAGSALDRTAALKTVEADQPAAFTALLVALYSLYYTDAKVREAIERVCGYRASAPQPDGYALPPFDPSIVSVPASRPRQYRQITEISP